MELGLSADDAARESQCTLTAIRVVQNEACSMSIIVDMLCTSLVASLHGIEEQLKHSCEFKRKVLQRVGRSGHEHTTNNVLARELLGMDPAVLAMLKNSKPEENTRSDTTVV